MLLDFQRTRFIGLERASAGEAYAFPFGLGNVYNASAVGSSVSNSMDLVYEWYAYQAC